MKRHLRWAAVAALLAAWLALPGTPALAKAPATGTIYVVQGLPDASVSVSVDGKLQSSNVAVKTILDPLELSAGRHTLQFRSATPSWTMNSVVTVTPGQSSDVVLHRPAALNGKPVVTVYRNPESPIAGGKGRVLVAHTAVVPPADITVNGEVIFANVANGEFQTADVPGGTYEVAVVPTGSTENPILGPMDLEVETQTLTQVFAIGQPQNGSMDVIVQKLPLQKAGSAPPTVINTGSAGLVADWALPGAESSARQQYLVAAALLGLAGSAMLWRLGVRRTRGRGTGGA